MNKDIEEIKTYATKLRADLFATNTALHCVFRSLPASQRSTSLALMARVAVEQEQAAVRSQNSEAISAMQASLDRLHRNLTGAHTLQLEQERASGA